MCARCAEEYDLPLDAPFTVVLTPRVADPATSAELTAEDLALGFYEGPEIDLAPLVSRADPAGVADTTALPRGVSWALPALRHQSEHRPVRLRRGGRDTPARRAAGDSCASKSASREESEVMGTSQAPDVVVKARQAPRARCAQRAARDRVPGVR